MTAYFKKLFLLDVGGTFIKCSDGREIPVSSDGTAEDIATAFREAAGSFCREALESGDDKFLRKSEDRSKDWVGYGIAVAIPGPFDYTDGIFLMKHKFAAVYGRSFREVAGIPDCVQLRFTHDVNIMLDGEMKCGNGRGWSRGALVTLGTGLGFALSIDGQILKKPMGAPLVSIYALPYRDGILEDYASKRGFLRTFASFGGSEALTVKDMASLAFEGNTAARETFSTVGRTIAETIIPILNEYRIECLLFGGQISRSFALMEPVLRESLAGVSSLRSLSPVSDFDNATFNGLRCLFTT